MNPIYTRAADNQIGRQYESEQFRQYEEALVIQEHLTFLSEEEKVKRREKCLGCLYHDVEVGDESNFICIGVENCNMIAEEVPEEVCEAYYQRSDKVYTYKVEEIEEEDEG